MSIKEFFRPFVKAKPWEIALCIAIVFRFLAH